MCWTPRLWGSKAQVMSPRIEARLRAALDKPARPSSDYDLNAGVTLPEGRVLRPAAVLVGVQDGPRGARIVLTKRASHLRHHPGQIAFPGGRQDACDADLIATALREASEEIALPPSAVQVLGTLPPHETVTGFLVSPVLALLATRPYVHPRTRRGGRGLRRPFRPSDRPSPLSGRKTPLARGLAALLRRAMGAVLCLGGHCADFARAG
jgi:8-oxo-dGTP pyrophosphatase MutT (NUDIX family)